MSTLLTMLLPAIIPVVTDGLKGAMTRLSGTVGPKTVAETIQLMEAQTKRVQALAELDKSPEGISHWVADVKALFRYAMITLIVLTTIAAIFVQVEFTVLAILLDLTGASMSFVIGERMYLGLKK